ncbi:MAG: hypothetical protein ACYDB4_18720 [Candidatus Dormibacteraceae bacterium]
MSSEPSRHPRERFEEFVRHVLAVPKAELDARLATEKRRKRKKPPPAN